MKNLIILENLHNNKATQLYGLQKVLDPFVSYIEIFWWILWFSVLTFLIYTLFKELHKKYKQQ